MKSLTTKVNEKLSPKYFGPYKIIEKVRHVAYKLKLSPLVAIHWVFHVSELRRAMEITVIV